MQRKHFAKHNPVKALLALAIVLGAASNASADVQWEIAKGRSRIDFRVKHFVLFDVKGRFKDYEASLTSKDDQNFSDAKLIASIPISSIHTGIEDRDSHLLQKEFFYVKKYPYMNFKSTAVKRTGKKTYDMHGVLSIRGKNLPITFKVEYLGAKVAKDGKLRAKFSAKASLNRYDYGLRWNQATETGGLVVDDIVNISMNITMIKQDDATLVEAKDSL